MVCKEIEKHMKERDIILNQAWQLFRDNIMDQEFNSEEDKECYLKECLDASLYFFNNAPKMLEKMLPKKLLYEPIEKRVIRDIKDGNNRGRSNVVTRAIKVKKGIN